MLNKTVALLTLLISGFYLYSLVLHILHPEDNFGYTRMLMFVWVATLMLVPMLGLIGFYTWPGLVQMTQGLLTKGASGWAQAAGIWFLLTVLPLGTMVIVWFCMDLKFGSLFLLFFVPLVMRLLFSDSQAFKVAALTQAVLFFGSIFAALAILRLLAHFQIDSGAYARSVLAVRPDWSDAAMLFFSVTLLALGNQVIEFTHALLALLGKK